MRVGTKGAHLSYRMTLSVILTDYLQNIFVVPGTIDYLRSQRRGIRSYCAFVFSPAEMCSAFHPFLVFASIFRSFNLSLSHSFRFLLSYLLLIVDPFEVASV
ncbi:hypothetical protein SISSUDRAFT_728763 [Sistotremastrum suecicum HHB10207 ss-3]|uniref:Uncharacterized protein n=1 Tax=Sistotremastrum suecicum HHB10207 ss-3 TaxID=1314776 RepID=A0A166DH98_9AGAM|nr:hypothetical protein SISSUDRAFT_728763 [Sistotremastrum suecicum HHB10207 ss-3]